MSDTDAYTYSMPVRVYIEDTDAGGIVYYVNYLKFMERARTEFIRQFGIDKPAVVSDEHLFVVHSADVRYLRPAMLDDLLTVTASISKLARSYMLFRQEIIRNGEPISTADIKVACVLRDSMKPSAMPKPVYAALQGATGS